MKLAAALLVTLIAAPVLAQAAQFTSRPTSPATVLAEEDCSDMDTGMPGARSEVIITALSCTCAPKK